MARKGAKATVLKMPAKTVVWKGNEHSIKALAAKELGGLEAKFQQYQSTRDRDAVYGYLTAIYRFAHGFEKSLDCKRVARQMAAQKGLVIRDGQDQRFSLLIRSTATVNEKTRWKWRKCLAYAWSEEVEPQDLKDFIKGVEGINGCAAKWTEN
jgi:hypothetical protein